MSPVDVERHLRFGSDSSVEFTGSNPNPELGQTASDTRPTRR
jgi:hypothetical protein